MAELRICSRCVLPASFPGIRFDDNGVCNFCRTSATFQTRESRRAELQAKFARVVESARTASSYHCLVAWSGGKDSTYTLAVLKEEFELRVLAYTFDNGFVSPAAWRNMQAVSSNLNVDQVVVRPRFDFLRQVFRDSVSSVQYARKALSRTSAICNSCMGLAKFAGLRIAIEQDIPMVAFGWSPGQLPLSASIYRPRPAMAKAMMGATVGPLQRAGIGDASTYFLQDRHFAAAQHFPWEVSPLAFLDYHQDEIFRRIERLGWSKPSDTGPNSTNCLLNSLGILVHQTQTGFHPYASELATLVREGKISRDEALRRMETPENPDTVRLAMERLGLASLDFSSAQLGSPGQKGSRGL